MNNDQLPSNVISCTNQSVNYDLYLHGEIVEASNYMEHLLTFKMANPEDTIRLWINSEGGRCDTGFQFIEHMRECQAQIIAVIGMNCASMASLIALEADHVQLSDWSQMMLHSMRAGTYGEIAAAHEQLSFYKKLNDKLINQYCNGFLTDEQKASVLAGKDVYLDADEIAEAWERREEQRQDGDIGLRNDVVSVESVISKAIDEYTQRLKQEFDITPKKTKKTVDSKKLKD